MKSKEREGLTPIALREKAAAFARETVAKQRDSFKRYGVWGEWEEPYLTLQPEYEAAQERRCHPRLRWEQCSSACTTRSRRWHDLCDGCGMQTYLRV